VGHRHTHAHTSSRCPIPFKPASLLYVLFLPESWLTPYIPAPTRDGVQTRYIQGTASHADGTDVLTDH